MRTLVTGAAGKLGSQVVAALVRAGHEVRATDSRFRADLSVPLRPANLLDEHALYPLLEGCDALVHLGNHPNHFAGPSPQRLLAENTSMNANAFFAAIDSGASWGYFDFRRIRERYEDGFQSLPVDWSISSVQAETSQPSWLGWRGGIVSGRTTREW